MAFNVFKAQEMVAKSSQQARLQQKAAALRPLVTPPHEQGKSMRFHPTRAQSKLALPGVCYKCSWEGHWSQYCPAFWLLLRPLALENGMPPRRFVLYAMPWSSPLTDTRI